ncbi:MAG: hypothetical protein ACRDKV_06990 [Solirubrobacterales bacterium]
MSERDAFEDEMRLRSLSDQDVERLMRGQEPGGGQLAEVAEFTRAVRQELSRPAAQDASLIARLAEASLARVPGGETPGGETETMEVPAPAGPRRRLRARVALAVRAVALIAIVPLMFAGLALADVTLPEPARDAFEAVGVTLPNQPAGGGEEGRGENATNPSGKGGQDAADKQASSPESAGHGNGRGESPESRMHGTRKSNPAREGGRGNGEQGQGRALGKRGLAPGQVQPPGQERAPGQLKQKSENAAGGPRTSAQPKAPPGRSGQSSSPREGEKPEPVTNGKGKEG